MIIFRCDPPGEATRLLAAGCIGLLGFINCYNVKWANMVQVFVFVYLYLYLYLYLYFHLGFINCYSEHGPGDSAIPCSDREVNIVQFLTLNLKVSNKDVDM